MVAKCVGCGYQAKYRNIGEVKLVSDQPAANTDRELFRENTGDPAGSYYEHSVHVTEDGCIGMNVGGTVIVGRISDWHARFGGYEQGYKDGESSGYADWQFVLGDVAGVPDEIITERDPWGVAEWISEHLVWPDRPA